jgi:hypothetical protein
MKYFMDCEFLEGKQDKTIFGIKYGETKPTIDLISIGIVAEDGREYYTISKDFNLKEAWNRCDLKKEWYSIDESTQSTRDVKVYWIRENVLKTIWKELKLKEQLYCAKWDDVEYDKIKDEFTFKDLKRLINKYGKTNKQIAEEIKEFCNLGSIVSINRNIIYYKEYTYYVNNWLKQEIAYGNHPIHYDNKPEFYGYYADYDWVAFCWLFGKMITLPKGFPMYCIDLKQELDEKANQLSSFELSKLAHGDTVTHNVYSTYDTGVLKCSKTDLLKNALNYPKQTNEHSALADSKFVRDLYFFLKSL